MERLTIRVDWTDDILFLAASDPEGAYNIHDIAQYEPDMLTAIAESLAAYEDTGLTPGEVQELASKARPMKPIPHQKISELGSCPKCKTTLCIDDEDLHYCPTCGQALALVI